MVWLYILFCSYNFATLCLEIFSEINLPICGNIKNSSIVYIANPVYWYMYMAWWGDELIKCACLQMMFRREFPLNNCYLSVTFIVVGLYKIYIYTKTCQNRPQIYPIIYASLHPNCNSNVFKSYIWALTALVNTKKSQNAGIVSNLYWSQCYPFYWWIYASCKLDQTCRQCVKVRHIHFVLLPLVEWCHTYGSMYTLSYHIQKE